MIEVVFALSDLVGLVRFVGMDVTIEVQPASKEEDGYGKQNQGRFPRPRMEISACHLARWIKGSVLVNACFARAPQQVIHVGTAAHSQPPGNPRGGHLSFCFKLHGNLHFPRLTLGQQDKLVLAQMHSMQTSTSDVVGLVGC